MRGADVFKKKTDQAGVWMDGDSGTVIDLHHGIDFGQLYFFQRTD
jgi:hypothetical protein